MDPNQILLTLYAACLASLAQANATNNTHKTPRELAGLAKDLAIAGGGVLVGILERPVPQPEPPPTAPAIPIRRTVAQIPQETCLNCGGPKNQPSAGRNAETTTGCRLTHYAPHGIAPDPNAGAQA